ncbi:hypothetical protein [Pedobacter duraquae]|uniref:Lipocalin-like protein n=1 Tax=Pedobacter duraquae TaxID=425511 RepID=A0A4R6IF22_9SPHI|nr:hypothetical protein [Pedobacter duraquae]TDO20920.1 hypothetical protein CLV32_3556 [Pedobacter duraquae]
MMSRIIPILSMVFFMSCINFHDEVIQNKKWRMVKESVTTADKARTSTSTKVKDFSIIDYLYFDSADQLSIISYGATTKYNYKIKDSVLTFENPKAFHKTGEYGIKVSNKDSLVLIRTETFGNDAFMKITAVLHMAAIK